MLNKIAPPQFAIEKDVPLAHHRTAKGAAKYPFAGMKVGDSFFVPGQTASGAAAGSGRQRNLKGDRKFTARTVDGGVRIWRIA